MTASIYTSAGLYTGIKQYGQITNTYGGYFTSGGLAYDLLLPFLPDKFEIWNYTKYGTNSSTLSSLWFRDMTAAYALQITRGTTDLSSALTTTNGFTLINTPASFTDQHVTITGITTATPGVVTAAAHGLADGDRVIISKLTGNIGNELNFKEYVAQNVTTNTFELYDIYGNPITVVSTYSASGGQITKEGPRLGVQNSQPVYGMTLGTSVVGADGDVMYFQATQFNSYFNYGDIGA